MGTSSRMTPPLVVAILLVATVALTDATPPYKCQEFFSSGNATIEPKGDIIREVGDPFEAYCLFDSRYINASDVSFVYRGKRNDVPVEYQLPNYTIVNASAIKLNYISDRAEDFHLLCRIDSKSLCFRQVRIGYRPQEVKNFTCLSKNWSDLNCTWVAPYNPVQAQYHVMYVVPGFRFQSECPKRHHHANWCYFPPEEFGRIVKHYLIMRINATNVLAKEGVLFEYNVSLVETVVPEPVKDLKANVDGPSNITLTWQLPHPMDTFDKVLFEAAYRERFEGDVSENVPWHMVKQWKVAPQRFSPTEKFNITVNDLHAYTMHDFRVRMHTGFGDIRPHMWSEASILPERTAATYPTVAPKTTNGTFEVTETLSYREIYIFWQMVDQIYHNAPNFHYKINVFENESNRLIAKDDAEVDIKQSYAKFSNMEKDLTYRFEIIPMNDEGPPQNDNVKAIVMVPRKEDVLKQPTFFKVIAYSEPNNTVYSLKWRAEEAEAQGAETVTLFWCKKDKYEERCLNKLEWEIVDDPSLNVKNITHLEETSLYMFGISVNSQCFSTGIKWITCIASYGTQPPPLENFEVSEISSTKALLEWSLDCKAKAAEPIGFKISYCVAEDKDSKKCPADIERSYEEIRDETAVEYVVKDLHPYTNYIFNIAILTQIGPSKWSESINRKTEADKPSGPPQQFQVVESGQSWALLNWTPPLPTERNGEIVRYLVKYDSSYGLTEKVLNSEDAPPYNVTELEPYSNYKFQVTACTKMRLVGRSGSCGDVYAPLEMKTKIGAPSKVDDIFQMDEYVKWNHECSNGPACFYQLLYTINSTEYIYETELNAASINIKDLNITCTKDEKKIVVKLRAVTYNESNQKLFGSWKEEDITCFLTDIQWWIIVVIVAVAGLFVIIILVVGRYGWDKVKEFLMELKRTPVLPPGLEDVKTGPCSRNPYYWPQISRDSISHEKQKSTCSLPDEAEENECQDLIPPGVERGGRNLSGDSGTSETDPGDSSGCSTGGESDSSSASDRHHQSSDSGTVQEEPGFPQDENKWGSLRLRTPGTPYVRQGLPEGVSVGYVSASSVPNLAVGMSDGSLPLQPFTPTRALGTLPEMPLRARTSTGYISMPDADVDAISLDLLNSHTLTHEGRQPGFPPYSRHNLPYKKVIPELSPYTKTGSLPWLNTGYVLAAQADGGRRETPQARGYVAVSDAPGIMKRQPSLPSLSTGFDKSVSTPEEELPPGTYCRVGSRNSPGPPAGASAGYVGIPPSLPLHTTPNSLTTPSPSNKPSYVTCAIAESLVSPSSTPEKVSRAYGSVGEFPGDRWAHPVIQHDTGEEGREVASAPVESSRGRPNISPRPSTSDATVNHNRRGEGGRLPPLGPSLSKQSSGYVSQETLPFHEPVVMSPKRLLAQSHEPHSVVLSANHKASMV